MRIDVVAGILRDRDARVLLAERKNDKLFSGLWEFPGGKRHASETPEGALVRELAEELGIEVTKSERLASVDHDYVDRLVHLDFFLVTEWCGEVQPMDGQALRWLLPDDIDIQEILPADAGIIKMLRSL
jgi:8-oxo-dGTP diphosphatase